MMHGEPRIFGNRISYGMVEFEDLGAVIWSQLFLRIAGSAGVLVIGGYFVELHDKGLPITSVLVGVVAGLVYLLGNLLGGVAAQAAYFDGLAYLTIVLAAARMLSLGVLLLLRRKCS